MQLSKFFPKRRATQFDIMKNVLVRIRQAEAILGVDTLRAVNVTWDRGPVVNPAYPQGTRAKPGRGVRHPLRGRYSKKRVGG